VKIVPVCLAGAAIRLVPLALAHLDALCEIGLEPQLWRRTIIQVRTRAEMEEYVEAALADQRAGTALPFVIVEARSGAIIGTTRLQAITPSDRRLGIGFTWVALPWQRTVVNTEAKYLLLRHAFEVLGCNRVEFKADAGNEPSRRALLRIGASEEGILRSYRVSASRGIRDVAVFSIIASEWPRIRAELEMKLRKKY
jgi:RimJ/RimL family protein N-acetyltransferase